MKKHVEMQFQPVLMGSTIKKRNGENSLIEKNQQLRDSQVTWCIYKYIYITIHMHVCIYIAKNHTHSVIHDHGQSCRFKNFHNENYTDIVYIKLTHTHIAI